jgi:hypothetical protein
VLLVELDTQSSMPATQEGLRVIGNPVRPDGVLALCDAAASLPHRVLPGYRDVRNAFAHLDQPELNQLRQVGLIDHRLSFRGDILQRPSEIDRVEPELGERICFVVHA